MKQAIAISSVKEFLIYDNTIKWKIAKYIAILLMISSHKLSSTVVILPCHGIPLS
jgi:hypothetical protein